MEEDDYNVTHDTKPNFNEEYLLIEKVDGNVFVGTIEANDTTKNDTARNNKLTKNKKNEDEFEENRQTKADKFLNNNTNKRFVCDCGKGFNGEDAYDRHRQR